MMDAAVIIVKYGAEREFRACVKSARSHTPRTVPIVIHDNGPKNENLGMVWNRMIMALAPEIGSIVLLNPDTKVSPGWLKGLVAGVDLGHAAVGPVTNNCGYAPQVRKPAKTPAFVESQALSGFCFALERRAFDELGGFREDFPLYGQDSELFMRLRRRPRTLAVARHIFVYHTRSASGREAERRGKLRLSSAHAKGAASYHAAVKRERRERPRVLAVVPAGSGGDECAASLRASGMDEVHVVAPSRVASFVKSRERFFEAAVCPVIGQRVELTRADVLRLASAGGATAPVKVIRLPLRRGDA